MDDKVSYDTLKKAYIQAAQIVAVHGEKYLPIFERIEKEYQARTKQLDTLKRALKIAHSDQYLDKN